MSETDSRNVGRPKKVDGKRKKLSVTLSLEDIIYLDTLCVDILCKKNKVFHKCDIMRACIEALRESKLDLTNVNFVEDIKELILSSLTNNNFKLYQEEEKKALLHLVNLGIETYIVQCLKNGNYEDIQDLVDSHKLNIDNPS
jgi:hypothetical protein